jgi:TetR/AcrR family transcriptional regulator, repressor for uid operon
MTATPGEFGVPGALTPNCVAERILAAASDLCTLVGVKQTTITDIARYADIDDALVRSQWDTVTDIVTAVVIRDFQAGLDDTESRIRAHDQLRDLVAEAFAAAYWFLDSHPIVGGVVRSDADTLLPTAAVSITAVVTAVARWLVGIVAAAAHRRAGLSVDAERLEEVTTRLIQSMLLAPNVSAPTDTFGAIIKYAGLRYVPLVYAMCLPGTGEASC